ncbi:ATP-grasp domain-containing protein [Paraclostridium ghonii]|uniref:ATP-grasp domain-containing protein n=1 Tax=Paraclostridium ghonii TaxID=29358 RepID=UPI00202CE0E3|nr:ATP-grasp domain-containing protein [Paeniclostridium ghonii]MCM0165829.1 ATP-grasp domain-containing protein [Paeniclostridium ghonii]
MNQNKKVLVLGVASVQMDAIIQLKQMGYETYACAMKKDGPGADIADHFEVINILDKEAIIKYIEKNNISLVYSVGSDIAMPVSCYISEKLGMPHFVSEKTAYICNNKDLMRHALGEGFNGNIAFQVVKNIEEQIQIEFPFILKPADSQGQRGVRLINNYEEYLQNFNISKQYSRSGLVMIEQYISGKELSVNGYVVDGKIEYLIISDRDTWEQHTGLIHKHIVPACNIDKDMEEDISKIIYNACKKLGINNGPVYAQMKLEKNKPYIIEITPRLDGCHMWKLLSYYTGINLLKLTFEHLLNNNTAELDLNKSKDEKYVLEFICQQPNTKADYIEYKNKIESSVDSFKYYNQGDNIRPVNGIFDKIGYFIYEI